MNHETPVPIAHQDEVDREMHKYCQRLAEQRHEERCSEAAIPADPQKNLQSDVPQYVGCSLAWQKAKTKVAQMRAAAQERADLRPTFQGLPVNPIAVSDTQDVAAHSEYDKAAESIDAPPSPADLAAVTSHPISLVEAAASCLSSASPVCPDNCFPVVDVLSIVDHPDPFDALTKLCPRVYTASDYRRERVRFVEHSVQLNLLQRLAPAYRPTPHVVGVKFVDPVRMLMLRDSLMIDYHWCHATKMDLAPNDARHAALLDLGHDFDFALAWSLACENWSGVYRATEAVILTTFQQAQTKYLRGREVAASEAGLRGGYRDSKGKFSSRRSFAQLKIREWAERRSGRKAERLVYEMLWLARELLGCDSARFIPQLLALMLGGTIRDSRTIRGKLATLDKLVSS